MKVKIRSLVAAFASVSFGMLLAAGPHAFAQNAKDAQLQADVQKALDNKRLKNVSAFVQDSNVGLAGTVQDYADKEYADQRVHHVKGIKGVDNEIQVAGPTVDDATLRRELAGKLSTYTVGYGTTAFGALTLNVQNGVVTVGGTVYWPPDKNAALGIISETPGVKDVIDNIDVAPVSPMDDQLRMRLARVIYGTPELQKYAIDPAKPIRIIVVNGKVTLVGVVDNNMDKEIAGMRANSVPGVFKVTNDLQVANGDNNKK